MFPALGYDVYFALQSTFHAVVTFELEPPL